MATLRPEYGPSLPTLLAPRFKALPRVAQVAIAGVVALVVLLVVVRVLAGGGSGLHPVLVREPTAFTLGYKPGMERVAPIGREVLRLQTKARGPGRQSFAVTPLTLPAYRGDASAGFLAATANDIDQMRRTYPGFDFRAEGRARVAELPGYQIQFAFRREGHTAYGRRVLLVPDEPGARKGIDITMIAGFSPAVANIDAVGSNGQLKSPYRSLRFGTDRP